MSLPFRQAVAAVEPRPAATVLIVRDGATGLEVLMVRRSLQASFMPGAYVFPGGAVDAADAAPLAQAVSSESAQALQQRLGAVTQLGAQAAAYAVGALRECFEECGLWLGIDAAADVPRDWAVLRAQMNAGTALADLAQQSRLPLATHVLQPWARWVTPVGIPKRFDTLFLVAPAPAGQAPSVDEGETTTLAWVHPVAALQAHAAGEFPMEFATVSTVRTLEPFAALGMHALLAHAAGQPSLPPVHPRLRVDAEGRIQGVVLPGEAGYDEAYTG